MEKLIRTFIAIELDGVSRHTLSSFIDEVKKAIRGNINWTKIENLHFTLKFLGEISNTQIEEVSNIINKITIRHTPFEAKVTGIGFFPAIKRPRIIWAGISDGKENMLKIANDIESSIEHLGFKKENREFTAHLTIARVRDYHIKIDHKILDALSKEDICTFKVDHITLFKSELLPSGPVYSILKEFPLSN